MADANAPVIATGVAGILAGAVSMGIGEWLSMTAQAEGLTHELEVERKHLEVNIIIIPYKFLKLTK